MAKEALLQKISERKATVGVIGLGYVGLPLVLLFNKRGFPVIGIDVDPRKVEQLRLGNSYIEHISSSQIEELNDSGSFRATTDPSHVNECDAVLLCVPTPLTRNREPDMTYIERTAEAIAPHLRRGQLISLESTTYPGTTAEVLVPILEKQSGLIANRDFFVAYSPEREDPNNQSYSTETIPKVVGGDTADALELATELYGGIVKRVVPVSSAATAEATKLVENIFRCVNIAMVNELKMVFQRMGIDIWEVIEAAKTKPFGYMPFYPGPGLGGHCIPIDPFYLTWKAREFGINTRFIELAGEINTAMPRYVVARLAEELSARRGKAMKGARILMIGLAYKKNVDDMRESPALTLIELLEQAGAKVAYHDPFIKAVKPSREHAHLAGRKSVTLTPKALSSADAVLIVTDHDSVDYALIGRHARLVLDTRNVMARTKVKGAHIRKA